MKASKTLASAVAAAAVVGAIGMAYAQTPDTTTQPASPTDTSSQTMQNQPADTSTPSTTAPDVSAAPTERPAQADRN